jgi:hypothetical protein
LVGLRLQSLLGPGSRHCYGIITLKTQFFGLAGSMSDNGFNNHLVKAFGI